MIQTVPLNCSTSRFLAEPNGFTQNSKLSAISKSASSVSTVCRSVSRNNACIPKLEPFSRSKIDRAVKEPPLIQKSEDQIADYCLTLEGDDSYRCWEAYFELKDLEKETPKEEVERLIIEAGGVKTLIKTVHGVAAIHKEKKERGDSLKRTKPENTGSNPCPIPDGLPKTAEEIEEEEKGRMPDSPFTRLLRARGRYPAWYSPAPEHETD
ncbi:hypothetical protein PHJA_002528700 [Phtheirospermum japonicum]|uniref:CCG-binding protein 1 n=1 Tax=Phtheirospermum japonicum TaxID=374723 RepID=A0A830D1W7_9LAMI|nr:hypothetical protein PHJA_002528700 [Phtheirospermum japonicum]